MFSMFHIYSILVDLANNKNAFEMKSNFDNKLILCFYVFLQKRTNDK